VALRRLGHLLLAAALVIAGQGALEHPLVHLDEVLHAHAPGGDQGHEHSEDRGPACGVCVAFAADGAGVTMAPQRFATTAAADIRIAGGGSTVHAPALLLAYSSQAPPRSIS